MKIPPSQDVVIAIGDTLHYNPSVASSSREFKALIPPIGLSIPSSNPDQPATSTMAMFHQLWCLEVVRDTFVSRNITKVARHCLGYLRQTVLCHSDTHVEALFYSPERPDTLVNIAGDYRCKDWSVVYRAVERLSQSR
jgi:hypothetical protein